MPTAAECATRYTAVENLLQRIQTQRNMLHRQVIGQISTTCRDAIALLSADDATRVLDHYWLQVSRGLLSGHYDVLLEGLAALSGCAPQTAHQQAVLAGAQAMVAQYNQFGDFQSGGPASAAATISPELERQLQTAGLTLSALQRAAVQAAYDAEELFGDPTGIKNALWTIAAVGGAIGLLWLFYGRKT